MKCANKSNSGLAGWHDVLDRGVDSGSNSGIENRVGYANSGCRSNMADLKSVGMGRLFRVALSTKT